MSRDTWTEDDGGDGGPPGASPSAERYTVLERLGGGGMGEVFSASDARLRRLVAVKVLKGGSAPDRDRFVAEAQVTAQLDHPNIVPVHDLGELPDGRPFLAMKQVHGASLRDWVARAPAPTLDERLDVVRRVCDAMAFAHFRGVLHRDLKPDNVMVGAFGEVLVMDWGLARPIGAAPGSTDGGLQVDRFENTSFRTAAGRVAGTPAYMAPEQAEGRLQDLDARTDVYAIGALIYELLAGVPAFQGRPEEVLAAVRAGDVTPLRRRAPGVPRELGAVVDKAMALSPADRYPDCGALREDLDAWLQRRPMVHVRSSFGERWAKWAQRHRGAVRAAGGVAALAVTVLLAGSWWTSAALERSRQAAVDEARRARAAEVDRGRELARARLSLSDARAAQHEFTAAWAALDGAAGAVEAGSADAVSVTLATAALVADSPRPLSVCTPHPAARVRALAVDDVGERVAVLGDDGAIIVFDSLDCRVLERSGADVPPGPVALGFEGARAVAASAGPPPEAAPQPGGNTWTRRGDVRLVTTERNGQGGGVFGLVDAAPRWVREDIQSVDVDAGATHALTASSRGVEWTSLDAQEPAWSDLGGPARLVGVARGDRWGWALRFSGALVVLDLRDGVRRTEIAASPAVSAVAASRDARLLATAEGSEVTTWLVPTSSDRRARVEVEAAQALAVAPSGRWFAVGDEHGVLRLVDLPTGTPFFTWAGPSASRSASVAPDESRVAFTGRDDVIRLVELPSGVVREVPLPARPPSVVFTPSGRLFAGSVDGRLFEVDPVAGAVVREVNAVRGAIWHLSADPRGRVLAGSQGLATANELRWFDPATGELTDALPAGRSWYRHAVSPDGASAAVGTQDGTVVVFDAASGAVVRELKADDGPTIGVAFSPDGAWVASTGYSTRVTVWDVASGRELRSLRQHDGPGTNLAFSPDGAWLLSTAGAAGVGRWAVVPAPATVAGLRWWERVGPADDAVTRARAALALGGELPPTTDPYAALFALRAGGTTRPAP